MEHCILNLSEKIAVSGSPVDSALTSPKGTMLCTVEVKIKCRFCQRSTVVLRRAVSTKRF